MRAFEEQLKDATKPYYSRIMNIKDSIVYFREVRNSILPNLMVFLGKLLQLEKFSIKVQWIYNVLVYLIEHPIELKLCYTSEKNKEKACYSMESLRNPNEVNLEASDFIKDIISKNHERLESKPSYMKDLRERSQRQKSIREVYIYFLFLSKSYHKCFNYYLNHPKKEISQRIYGWISQTLDDLEFTKSHQQIKQIKHLYIHNI